MINFKIHQFIKSSNIKTKTKTYMAQRLTQIYIQEVSNKRNHTLISLSNPDNPRDGRKGTAKILCFCGHTFETNVHSYLNSVNGCPMCKSQNFKLNNPNRGKSVTRKKRKK